MPLGILIIALQIFFAVHAIRNRKDNIWLWIIILAPGIGCAIYFFTQFAPDAAHSQAASSAKKGFFRFFDPERNLRKRKDLLEISNTVENRLALAEEYIYLNMYKEAGELLRAALVGLHKTDPAIMERLAQVCFADNNPSQTTEILDALIAANPSYKSSNGHLLYARALAMQGREEDALKEYEVLSIGFPGEEARIRYAQLLQKHGQNAKAVALYKESLLRARSAPKHYQKKEKEWLRLAGEGVKEIESSK